MQIDVVLPCLNEAAALPWVLDRMPSGFRAIVADNASEDGSGRVAARRGAQVVTVPPRGFGAACHGGLLAAVSEVVCFMDADGSLDPAGLPRVAGPVRGGTADLMLGRRRPDRRGAWPVHGRLGNRVVAAAVGRRTGVVLGDIGPMGAARRDSLLGPELADRRFSYPLEMVIRAAGAGLRIAETDVPYRPRAGRSKASGTVGGILRTVRDMRRVLAAPSCGPAT